MQNGHWTFQPGLLALAPLSPPLAPPASPPASPPEKTWHDKDKVQVGKAPAPPPASTWKQTWVQWKLPSTVFQAWQYSCDRPGTQVLEESAPFLVAAALLSSCNLSGKYLYFIVILIIHVN